MEQQAQSGGPGSTPTLGRIVFWSFVAIAAYFVLTEHRAHLVAWLPYALVLACPLMHLMHGRHGGHGGHRHGGASGTDRGAEGDSRNPTQDW